MNESHIKTDEYSILLFCNTLNALQGVARHRGDRLVANALWRAQETIVVLLEENKALKGEKMNEQDHPSERP